MTECTNASRDSVKRRKNKPKCTLKPFFNVLISLILFTEIKHKQFSIALSNSKQKKKKASNIM